VKKIVFLDLDDTLFQSRQKCPGQDDLSAAAYLQDGSAHSFMTAKQRAFWQLLDEQMTVIPTTARDGDAFRRVRLPFRSWSILDYGGVVLDPDGQLETHWRDRMRLEMQGCLDELAEILDACQSWISAHGLKVRTRLIEDFGQTFYLVAKYQEERAMDLDALQQELVAPWVGAQGGDFVLHRNGNNLAVLPARLGKQHAVRYLTEKLRAEHGDLLTFGMGDSLIDGAFMAECDYAVTPRATQLSEHSFGNAMLPLLAGCF
jgi:hydroxymethylpyrimidine pyrophosphatase-like HAD family hydrolase